MLWFHLQSSIISLGIGPAEKAGILPAYSQDTDIQCLRLHNLCSDVSYSWEIEIVEHFLY